MFRKIRLNILIGLSLVAALLSSSTQAAEFSKVFQAKMEDGVKFRVYFVEHGQKDYKYAQQVLDAACFAYNEVVCKQGFNRQGYTYAHPNRLFAYDSDQVIDIYIADIEAPYAQTLNQGSLEYKAEIYIPADYQAYRERYNIDQPEVELKASLTHELLHIISYSYNRNMQSGARGKTSLASGGWDWYCEGLARYFETLAGFEDEFLSPGFRKSCGDGLLVYKGGVNYFLQYPDRPLQERKYDFALFWQYLDQHYGMDKIEEISCKFRDIDAHTCSNEEAMQIVAQTLGLSCKELWRNFSLYVYLVSSLEDEKKEGFNSVSYVQLPASCNKAYSTSSFGLDYYLLDLKQGAQYIQLKDIGEQRDLICSIAVQSPEHFISAPVQTDRYGGFKIDTTNFPQGSKIIIILGNPTNRQAYYRLLVY